MYVYMYECMYIYVLVFIMCHIYVYMFMYMRERYVGTCTRVLPLDYFSVPYEFIGRPLNSIN
jgi:hypothetical protein